MKEVSSKAFELFFKPLRAKGIALESILAGTGVSPETVRDKHARVSWVEFCAIMKNVRPHFTDDEYIDLGRSFFRSPGLRFAFVIARLLLTPMGFYRFQNKPRHGAGNQLFTCIIPKHHDISEYECEVDLTVPDGYEVCWDFWQVTIGTFSEMPSLLGYPPAKVELTRLPNGGRYHIVVPRRQSLFARLRRALAWPFTARAAARELREAHETLIDHVEEIEDARAKLARQATQLHTAHVVTELVQRDLDLARTLETIVTALVTNAGFTWAEIRVTDGAHTARAGAEQHEPALVRTLTTHGGKAIGELSAAPKTSADLREHEELLAFILPSLAMAVENASYRAGLEQLVEERTAELREAQRARERFFGHISHEIRTPLTIITLAASDVAFRAGDALDKRAQRNLEAVNDAARKLVRLVDELLLLAAGQEGKLSTHPEPTDLAELLLHIESAWQLAIEQAGLSVVLRVPESLVATVDPIAIERVVSNLVSNAVKYTPRGGTIEIELALETTIRLSVFDTGPGIGAELAGRLFGRYQRARSPTATGTGLGLALSKHLVEAHGGTIAALPRATGGSELRVVLPSDLVVRESVARAPVQLRLVDHAPVETPTATEHVPAGTSRGTILLAEDDARLAELAARLLAEDYTVVVAADGLAALELARIHQPQLLITDVDMPGLDGMELARRFRELTGDRLAPIIILSAMLDLGTRLAGLEAGAVDYITKPFDPVELRARVDAQFRARDLALRLHRAEQVSSLGILTSGLAHELRNPANAIANAIDPLLKKLPAELVATSHPVGQLVDVIRECADQIRALAKQLLGVRGNQLEMRPAGLRDLVQRSISLAQPALSGVDVRLDVEAVTMKCAPPLFTQALTNLLENAGFAAGSGGWVAIRARSTDSTLSIEVEDSGPGVPTALRERVFEPFFTTKPLQTGTGLGLSLVREIVQRHGGTIDIQERGSRSLFVISLHGVCIPVLAADAV